MADIRNNKPAEVHPNAPAEVYPDTRTRQPFLTELYPGSTPLPNEPQFKDPASVRKEMKDRGVPFINKVRYSNRFTGSPNDQPVTATIYTSNNNTINSVTSGLNPYRLPGSWGAGIRTPGTIAQHTNTNTGGRSIQLSGNTVPYYPATAEIWRRVTGSNVPTNKEIVNIQAGDPDYFDRAVRHYTNVPGADYKRAGLWRFPAEQMREYGNKTAIVPKIKQASQDNAVWSPAEGSIEVHRQEAHKTPVGTEVGDKKESVRSRIMENNGVAENSNAGLGKSYSHEFNHSMSMPAQSPDNYEVEVGHDRNFNITPESDPYWTIAPSGGFVSSMYSAAAAGDSVKYADKYGKLRMRRGDDGARPRPPKHYSRVPAVGTVADYAGFVTPGSTPANPVFRREPVLYKGEKYTDGSDVGTYSYAYNHNELTQGLISLNRAQHLLQQNIKKNPQAYIDAGIDPSALGQFMQMPTFLKSPEQLDQRMEFYHNHPEFSVLLGHEPARIIPRYFMLEQERRNPKQSQEWRDYHQDMFNFTRANYFMARNGNNQNPMDTGMGKLYNNLA